MAAKGFENLLRRFLRDDQARLALAPVQGRHAGSRRDRAIRDALERQDARAQMLFIALAAGLYVIARIGLTYAIAGH